MKKIVFCCGTRNFCNMMQQFLRLKEKANYMFKTFDRFIFFKILQIFFEVADRQKQSLLLYCLNKTKVTNSETG